MFLAALIWRFLIFAGFSNDHYVHLARAHQMLLGAWPIRDFTDPGMPLMYVTSAVGQRLVGGPLRSEVLIVALGFALGAAASAAGAARLGQSVGIGLVAALLVIVSSPRSYSYPKVMLYGMGGCVIVAIAALPSRRRILLAAAFVVVAFLFRHDHGAYLGVAGATAVLLTHDRGGWAAATRRCAMLVTAVGALLLPWAAFVQANGGVIDYFTSAVDFSGREAEVSVLRHWPTFTTAFDTDGNAEAWLYYLFNALPLVCLALAWREHVTGRERWRGESAAVAAISVMAFAVNLGFLRDPLPARVPDAVVPAALLSAWLVGPAWASGAAPTAGRMTVRLAAAALFVVTSAAIWRSASASAAVRGTGLLTGASEGAAFVSQQWTLINRPELPLEMFPSYVSAALIPFFQYVHRCTAPSDRLLVTGQYPDVFVIAGRGFAGGHVAFMQGFYVSPREQARTLARLARESVPFAVIVLDSYDEFRTNFAALQSHIAQEYRLLTDVPVPEMKGIRILVDGRRHVTRVDAATGWPCFR